MIRTAFNGFCMALADSVPGVSGGTIAFILGFYERFINALRGAFVKDKPTRESSLLFLLNLGIGWGLGICASVMLLAGLFTRNIYFMSSVFLGLTAASIPFIIIAEKDSIRGKLSNIPFAILGCASVVALTAMRGYSATVTDVSFFSSNLGNLLYIFIAGMIAIAAMVLPGMSGSTVLLIAGVYLPTIAAVKGLLLFDLSGLPGLFALALGVIVGIACSINFLQKALRKHHSKMIWLILGLLVGSLYAIIMGPSTLSVPLPALSIATFNALGFAVGILVLLALELLRKRLA